MFSKEFFFFWVLVSQMSQTQREGKCGWLVSKRMFFFFCCMLAVGFWFEFCVKLAKFDPPREFTPFKTLEKDIWPKKGHSIGLRL